MGKFTLRLRNTSKGSIETENVLPNKEKIQTYGVKCNVVKECKGVSVGSMQLSKSTSGKIYWCPSDKNIIVEMHGQWHS